MKHKDKSAPTPIRSTKFSRVALRTYQICGRRAWLPMTVALIWWQGIGHLEAADKEPVALFDGKTLDGWEGDTEKTWRIENGTIAAGSLEKVTPRNEFLATTKQFADFELQLKFKTTGTHRVNAGVQFRTRRIPNHHEVSGYQADIGPGFDGHLYDESRRNRMLAVPKKEVLQKALKAVAADGWHSYRIRAEGDRIQLWLNGVQTVDFVEKNAKIPRTGIIALQIHGGMKAIIAYKDITIEELPTSNGESKQSAPE